MTDTFEFFTGFSEKFTGFTGLNFHVYWNTVNWVPYAGQNMIFKG